MEDLFVYYHCVSKVANPIEITMRDHVGAKVSFIEEKRATNTFVAAHATSYLIGNEEVAAVLIKSG